MSRPVSLIAVSLLLVAFAATESLAHGGGCRKSSPAGQCCHADNSNGGRVHCH
ncbi:MAG: hypothetical protein Q4F71_09675 [Paracoccus sp. (in: a-proteobacteria)]|nr:hypothetical protein [Paracoccus sp. (in: a-proteobacteria)]